MPLEVLRFYAVMDDVTTPQFERRPFTIMFFLSDDSIEIREQYPLNCGRLGAFSFTDGLLAS